MMNSLEIPLDSLILLYVTAIQRAADVDSFCHLLIVIFSPILVLVLRVIHPQLTISLLLHLQLLMLRLWPPLTHSWLLVLPLTLPWLLVYPLTVSCLLVLPLTQV